MNKAKLTGITAVGGKLRNAVEPDLIMSNTTHEYQDYDLLNANSILDVIDRKIEEYANRKPLEGQYIKVTCFNWVDDFSDVGLYINSEINDKLDITKRGDKLQCYATESMFKITDNIKNLCYAFSGTPDFPSMPGNNLKIKSIEFHDIDCSAFEEKALLYTFARMANIEEINLKFVHGSNIKYLVGTFRETFSLKKLTFDCGDEKLTDVNINRIFQSSLFADLSVIPLVNAASAENIFRQSLAQEIRVPYNIVFKQCKYWFFHCDNLISVDFNPANVDSLEGFFYMSKQLKNFPDMSNTGHIAMYNYTLFNNSLTHLPNFDFSNATNMQRFAYSFRSAGDEINYNFRENTIDYVNIVAPKCENIDGGLIHTKIDVLDNFIIGSDQAYCKTYDYLYDSIINKANNIKIYFKQPSTGKPGFLFADADVKKVGNIHIEGDPTNKFTQVDNIIHNVFGYMCYNNPNLTHVGKISCNNASFYTLFAMCPKLERVEEVDCSGINRFHQTFRNWVYSSGPKVQRVNTTLRYMVLKGLGTENNKNLLYGLYKWRMWGVGSAEQLKSFKDSLLVYTVDRKAQGLPETLIELYTTQFNLLSDAERTAIKNKGYEIKEYTS